LTEGSPTGLPPEDRAPEPDPAPDAPAPTPTVAFGLTTFVLEGRRAPALFAIGWLGTIVGLGFVTITLLGAGGVAGIVLSVAGYAALSIGLIMLAGSQTVERKAAGADYAGPSPVLVFGAVIATSRLAGFAVGLPLLAVASSIPPAVGDLLGTIVQAVVFLGLLRLTVVGPGVLGWADMGFRGGTGRAVNWAITGALFAGPVILVTSLVGYIAVQLAGATPLSPLPPTGTTAGLVLHLLAGAVLAPVYEEALFRGFALTAWRRTVGDRGAIVRSSLLFVVAHVLFVGGDSFGEAVALAFVGGVVRLPIAFVLGWLYVRTGSIWGPIGLHAAFNGILIVLGEIALPQ
jgi:membrane protease YdiL (CAAX protease family)